MAGVTDVGSILERRNQLYIEMHPHLKGVIPIPSAFKTISVRRRLIDVRREGIR